MKYKTGSAKMYYTISEVAEMTGVKAHVLRYWETEFPSLRPKKNRAGNRNYRPKDIKAILVIRDLLYKEKFTISGARKKLQEHLREPGSVDQPAPDSVCRPAGAPRDHDDEARAARVAGICSAGPAEKKKVDSA